MLQQRIFEDKEVLAQEKEANDPGLSARASLQ